MCPACRRPCESAPDRQPRLILGLRKSLWGILIAFTAASPHAHAEADDQQILEQIRAGYAHSITSMRTIWCRYALEYVGSHPLGPGYQADDRTFEWAVDGERWHLSAAAFVTAAGTSRRAYWNSAEGESVWNLDHHNQELRRSRRIDPQDGIRGVGTPGEALGLYTYYGDKQRRAQTFTDLLETQPLTLLGQERIADYDCWGVGVSIPGLEPADDIPMKIWFDPAFSYLPRRIDWSNGDVVLTVKEFVQVKGEQFGQKFHFPSDFLKGSAASGVNGKHVRVQAVRINADLASNLFRPTPHSGFQVFDMENPRDVLANREKHRPRPSGTAHERRAAADEEQRQRNLKAASVEIDFDAAPPRSDYAGPILLLGGIVLLALCAGRSLLLRCLLATAAVVAPHSALADDEAVLNRIRAGYTHSITSMRTIWCRYTLEYVGPHPLGSGFEPIPTRTIEWAVDGDRWHHSSPAVEVGNGNMHASYSRSASEGTIWEIVENAREVLASPRIDHHDKITHLTTPGGCLGLYPEYGNRQRRGMSLSDILDEQPLTFGGSETINGHSCWRVSTTIPGLRPEDDLPMTAWFDPDHGYLPRQLDYDGMVVFTVDEFTEVREEEHSGRLFFPKQWVKRYPPFKDDRHEIVATLETRINASLPDEMFRPRIPPGYTLFDLSDPNQVRRHQEQHRPTPVGSSQERRAAAEAAQRRNRSQAENTSVEFDAAPSSEGWVAPGLIVCGLVLLSAATLARFRS